LSSVTKKTFDCQTGSFPFAYLGLPMGLTRPKVDDFLPLISRCERRLNYISPFSQPSWQIRAHQFSSDSFTNLHYMLYCSAQNSDKTNWQIQKTLSLEKSRGKYKKKSSKGSMALSLYP
jgi:hypothetical protein